MIIELPSARRRPSVELLRAVFNRVAAFGTPLTLLGSGGAVVDSANQRSIRPGAATDASEQPATDLSGSQITSILRATAELPSQVSIRPNSNGGFCIVLPGGTGHCLVIHDERADAKAAAALASGVERIASDLASAGDQRTLIGEFSVKLAQAYEETAALCRIMRLTSTQETPSEQIELICTAVAQTLPFRWVATAFRDDPGVIPELRGAAILAGDPKGGRRAVLEAIHEIARGVIDDGWTRVVQPSSPAPAGDTTQNTTEALATAALHNAAPTAHASSLAERSLADITGAEVVYDRITHDGRVIGVIVAGNKIGTNAQVTSGELQFVDACADLLGMFHENLARVNEQRQMSMGVLKALVNAIDAKDPYTRGHSERVAELSRRIAQAYGFTSDQCERIHIAGMVHDVGKIGVPDWVLRKPGRLNDEEFGIIKLHPEVGYRILQDIALLGDALPAVMHHHERFDGKGYPHGLAGENIPLSGRIVALADSFDAMCSSRAYRSGLSRERALEEVRNCAGRQYDPKVVEAFFKVDLAFYDQMLREQVVQLGEPQREEQHPEAQTQGPATATSSARKAA